MSQEQEIVYVRMFEGWDLAGRVKERGKAGWRVDSIFVTHMIPGNQGEIVAAEYGLLCTKVGEKDA